MLTLGLQTWRKSKNGFIDHKSLLPAVEVTSLCHKGILEKSCRPTYLPHSALTSRFRLSSPDTSRCLPKEFDFENELEWTGLCGLTINLNLRRLKARDRKQNINVFINNKRYRRVQRPCYSYPLLPQTGGKMRNEHEGCLLRVTRSREKLLMSGGRTSKKPGGLGLSSRSHSTLILWGLRNCVRQSATSSYVQEKHYPRSVGGRGSVTPTA